jgi:Tol biopolymer transport system component
MTLLLALSACGGSQSNGGTGGGGGGAVGTILFRSGRNLNGQDLSNDGVFNIWSIQSDGSGVTALTQLTSAAYPADSLDAVWSPDGTKIVYSSSRALDGSNASNTVYGVHNIWVMNADGSGATPLTNMTKPQMDCFAPVWSPDGTKIAYHSQRALDGSDTQSSVPYNIWLMNADGSNDLPLTQLTSLEAASTYPKWSPDGTEIAYESQRLLDGSDTGFTDQNIWVMNANGSGSVALTQLTALLAYAQTILWSKDGSEVLFTITNNNIWMAHPDGSGLTQLTNLTMSMNYVDGWSPDGTKLLFESTRTLDGKDNSHNQIDVWVMNADGSNALPLTKLNNTSAYGATWSPDGSQISYISYRDLNGSDTDGAVQNVWVMPATGSSTTPVTKLTKADSYPASWKP